MEVLKELSTVEVREVLEAIAWKKVQEEWDQEMETKPKLEILKRTVKLGEWPECVRVVRRALVDYFVYVACKVQLTLCCQ